MSDKPISVGDLVQVVRPYCCDAEAREWRVYGVPWRVRSIGRDDWKCPSCGKTTINSPCAWSEGAFGKGADRAPLSTLKRIPPLEDLKGVSEDARRPKTTEEFMKLVEEAQRQIREAS